ncbi:FAR1-related protein [Sesbania bispinosa]|nr:FAR1-related protein [Sesbania bispinosa]
MLLKHGLVAINSIVKTYVKKNSSIVEFMHSFEQALREYRNNELIADFKSLFSEPVLTTCLQKIEKDASKIYTLEMFKEVRKEIDKAGALIVVDRNIALFHVIVDFLKVVTKTAKSDFITSIESKEVHSDVLDGARLSTLTSYSSNFVKVAYENKGCFNEIVDDLFKLTLKFQKKTVSNSRNPSSSFIITDPIIVKTKGAPKKKKCAKKRRRHCSNCSGTGHTIRTCPKLGGTDVKGAKDDELCPSESTDSSGTNDSDKEPFSRDVANDHQCSQSNNVSKSNDKKGKAKVPVTCIRKEKKLRKNSQIQMKEVKKEVDIGRTDLKTENDQGFASFNEMSIPPYVYGPFYPPIQNMNEGSSWNQLLQQVVHNKGQLSGNNMNL